MTSYGKTWNGKAQNASDGFMVRKQEWVGVLEAIGNINFSVVERRQDAIAIWGKMKRDFPVAHDKQFPEFSTYVAMDNCDISRLVGQMMTALSFKESSKHRNEPEKQPGKNGSVSARDTTEVLGTLLKFSDEDDARQAFNNSVSGLKDAAIKEGCTYTRDSFETKFGLVWGSQLRSGFTLRTFVDCILESWPYDADPDKYVPKYVNYQIEENQFVVYADKDGKRTDSAYDLSKKNQYMVMPVVFADVPHFKFHDMDPKTWHFMIYFKERLQLLSYSGDCGVGSINYSSDFDFEDVFG